jgi:hypothetical protein
MTGVVVGRLTVKERAPRPNHYAPDSYGASAFWSCDCACGSTGTIRSGKYLRTAPNKPKVSCGCLLRG